MRTMTTKVTGRVIFPRVFFIDAGISTLPVKPLGTDQLLVAHGSIEFLTWRALAVPARDLLVIQLSILGGIAVLTGTV